MQAYVAARARPLNVKSGVNVAITGTLRNEGDSTLHFRRGKRFAFDAWITHRGTEDVIWHAAYPASKNESLQRVDLAPDHVLRRTIYWRQIDCKGAVVSPGEYSIATAWRVMDSRPNEERSWWSGYDHIHVY